MPTQHQACPAANQLCLHCGRHVTHLVTSKAVQTSTVVRNALNSVQELGTFYKESVEFKDLYLRGNDCIETYMSNKMVVKDISHSKCPEELRRGPLSVKNCGRVLALLLL